jgi:superfamily I DNA/RNA helicase
MNAISLRLFELNFDHAQIASREVIQQLIMEAAREVDEQRFSTHFLMTEWEQIVDAWQLETWDAYRDVIRLGRKARLTEHQRVKLWSVFERVRSNLKARDLITYSGLYSRLALWLEKSNHLPFDFVVVDEAQDVSVAQLRFLSALGAGRPNSLFFAGDLGQRVFQQPFSWKALGIDIRGRSRTLRINYRTSHQIRLQADRLLGPEISDVDGNTEGRYGTISVFNGPSPTVMVLDTIEDEIEEVSRWISDRVNEGIKLHELGVFVRSPAELSRACKAVEEARIPFKVLGDSVETTISHVSISAMHLAKGLEFRAVVVMACDDEVIPSQERIESVADDTDLEEVYNTERHLLYVACTRARDHLLVTSANPASEFLDDLQLGSDS